jgi:hypothetical protein
MTTNEKALYMQRLGAGYAWQRCTYNAPLPGQRSRSIISPAGASVLRLPDPPELEMADL